MGGIVNDSAPAPSSSGRSWASRVNELPSVALTRRFLALSEQHGSQRLAVRLVGRRPQQRRVGVAWGRRLDGVGR